MGGCPLLALSGHSEASHQCPLSGVKRTLFERASMSANDPKRTSNSITLGQSLINHEALDV